MNSSARYSPNNRAERTCAAAGAGAARQPPTRHVDASTAKSLRYSAIAKRSVMPAT